MFDLVIAQRVGSHRRSYPTHIEPEPGLRPENFDTLGNRLRPHDELKAVEHICSFRHITSGRKHVELAQQVLPWQSPEEFVERALGPGAP